MLTNNFIIEDIDKGVDNNYYYSQLEEFRKLCIKYLHHEAVTSWTCTFN